MYETPDKLAREFKTEIQEWMTWGGWNNYVGCSVCQESGTNAACWGLAGCHGYKEGCGCANCFFEEKRAMEKWMEARMTLELET